MYWIGAGRCDITFSPMFIRHRPGDGGCFRGRLATLTGIAGLAIAVSAPEVAAHTKGLTLSRFGLIDVSLTGNVDYAIFSNPNKVDFDKIGDRSSAGFNLTSFDVSLTGETPDFPMKLALFAAFEQTGASIEEAFFFF